MPCGASVATTPIILHRGRAPRGLLLTAKVLNGQILFRWKGRNGGERETFPLFLKTNGLSALARR
jgi:hypothetical protein